MSDANGGGILDDAAAQARGDPAGMLGRISGLADQLTAAWTLSRELELSDRHRAAKAVAVLGMGGSAIAGDLVRAIFADRLTVPLVSIRDYVLPAWVDDQTLVVAASHSGATEETISALSTALERRCPVAVISTGGPVGEVAARVDLPRLVYPDGGPPRAALGYGFGLLAGLLERAGVLELNEGEMTAAAAEVKSVVDACGPATPTATNLAKQLAWTLLDRLPVIEASGCLAPVARRWKTQLNENGKSAAVAEELPEATHNTVVGYLQPEQLRDHLYVVFLSGSADHPRNRQRATLSTKLLDEARIGYQQITLPGSNCLSVAWSGIALGDYVSTYLALLYGIDPSPVEALARVKASMSGAGADDDE
jgi:glucose/mannose-6-phosphate isomerase